MNYPTLTRLTNQVRSRLIIITLMIGLGGECSTMSYCWGDDRPIKFNRDIRGLLADRCLACHGPDAETVQADLRLDIRELAIDHSGVIIPGNASDSLLIQRILATDASEVMPPPELHKPLTTEEKELFRRWIDQGADYEPHWAYVPPQWPAGWEQDPPRSLLASQIDTMVQQRLQSEHVSPTEPADPITLIRRLSFDLTGIPPTAAEVSDFINDVSPTAYEKLVDRLLASPRFGEHMAVYWLDLVRYADTVGYHGDQTISHSPYRDYVINSFNRNLPYDQFIREQLAGDLLPDPTIEQLVASGYNRLNQTTEEGGSQAKEYLAIYFADRVRNASQVFLGSTLGCAQCHDHKYDPFTLRDFYSFGAFFADIEEVGVYGNRGRPPMMHVPDAATIEQLALLDRQLEEHRQRIADTRESLRGAQPQWESEILNQMSKFVETEVNWLDDQQGIVSDDQKKNGWNYIAAQQYPVHSGTRARKQSSDGLIQHLFQGVDTGVIVEAETRFFAWVYLDAETPPQAIMLQFNDGTWDHRKVWGSDDIAYGRSPESRPAYWRSGPLPELGQWVRLEVGAEEVGLNLGSKINGMAFTQFGGTAYWDDAGIISSQVVPTLVAQSLRKSPQDRNPDEAERVTEHYFQTNPAIREQQTELKALESKRKAAYESAPATVVSKATTPRPIRILPRGDWMDDSGELVEPAIPEFLGRLQTNGRATRLDLANWLCEPDNPLTARTMANRMWSLMFGRGLCASVDDFGGQGTYPSYPELLDLISLEFVGSGWDVKQLLKQIVLSQTYQRSSRGTPDLLQRDPYNDWFARQSNFGLFAESVRDSALSISGLLVEKVGGPSAHPYQPAGYYAQLNFPRRQYQADQNENQYRRGVYSHWQRTFLHPMLKAFDAPSREECTAQRTRSNTPLQALALLNDPSFVEAARVFAQRIMNEGGKDELSRIKWAYRQAVSREPSAEVAATLLQLFSTHYEYYRDHPAAADQLVRVGLAPLAEGLAIDELAAWTSLARAILNLHEVITRY